MKTLKSYWIWGFWKKKSRPPTSPKFQTHKKIFLHIFTPIRFLFKICPKTYKSFIQIKDPKITSLSLTFKLKTKGILYTDTRFINLHKLKSKGIFYTDTRFINLQKLKTKGILYTDTRFINLHKLKTKGIFYTDTRFINLHKLKTKGIFYTDTTFLPSN